MLAVHRLASTGPRSSPFRFWCRGCACFLLFAKGNQGDLCLVNTLYTEIPGSLRPKLATIVPFPSQASREVEQWGSSKEPSADVLAGACRHRMRRVFWSHPRVKEVFRRFFRTLQPMIHVIKKRNTYDFESKRREKNKTSGTYLHNRGSIASIYLDQTTYITSLVL